MAGSTRSSYVTGMPQIQSGRLYRLFDEYPNLYADLSAGSALRALDRDVEHARAFITRYADRLLFARDNYGGELHECLVSLALPDDVKQKVYCDNGRSLVKVAQPSDG
jgi:predicted TIM-barrel fold metal-dependent hydrolase